MGNEKASERLFRTTKPAPPRSGLVQLLSELFRMPKFQHYIPYSPASPFEASSPVISITYQEYVKPASLDKHCGSRSLSRYQPAVYQANGPLFKAGPPGYKRHVHLDLEHGCKSCLQGRGRDDVLFPVPDSEIGGADVDFGCGLWQKGAGGNMTQIYPKPGQRALQFDFVLRLE